MHDPYLACIESYYPHNGLSKTLSTVSHGIENSIVSYYGNSNDICLVTLPVALLFYQNSRSVFVHPPHFRHF